MCWTVVIAKMYSITVLGLLHSPCVHVSAGYTPAEMCMTLIYPIPGLLMLRRAKGIGGQVRGLVLPSPCSGKLVRSEQCNFNGSCHRLIYELDLA